MKIFFAFSSFFLLSFSLAAQDITKTVMIHGKVIKAHLDQWSFFVINSRKDTLVNIKSDFVDFKFTDFNKDGYLDIMLDLGGNIPDDYRLLLYVPRHGTFREVKYFDEEPLPIKISGSKYYYSYSKAGCADLTWVSYLFYLRNFQAIKIGFINGEGCDINNGIYIYQLSGKNKKLINHLPLKIINNYKDYKWGFLKQYWTKNYWKFIK